MMSEENYLLKWNDFEKNLSEGLRALKDEETFCDVTLACEDSQLEAHRVVLSVCSNFFQNILSKNSHSHPLLYLKGVRMADMESIIHFAYHGEANVALEDLESFLAAANELQIKGLTAPSVNSLRRSKEPERENSVPPAKKIKKEKPDPEGRPTVSSSRSVLKRRNTDSSSQEGSEDCENNLQLVDNSVQNFQENQQDHAVANFHEEFIHDRESVQLDDGNVSGSQADDVATEVKRLTDQYLVRLELEGGVMWSCSRCGKQGKMKHHVREHIESNHIDCLTFNCPFCNKEIKNRVALRSHISQSVKRSLATRLAFDETFEEVSGTGRKVTRLSADPLSQSGHLDTITSLQRENSLLKSRSKEMEAELAGHKAQVASCENKVKNLELERERQTVEWDRERGAVERERLDSREKLETLQYKLKQINQREADRVEDGSRARKLSIDRVAELEAKVSVLRSEKDDLEQSLMKTNIALERRPDIDKLRYNEEIQQLKSRVSELESKESVYQSEVAKIEQKRKQNEELLLQNEELEGQLRMEKLRASKLEGELEDNKDATVQRIAMRDKLEKYHDLESENISLRSQNKLLVDTAANSALLKEQVKQLEGDRQRLEGRVRTMDELRGELEVEKKINTEWSSLVSDWSVDGGSVTVVRARQIVSAWQQRELGLVDQVNNFRLSDQALRTKLEEETSSNTKLEAEMSQIKTGQEDQAKLMKKLQRKLLLVAKERDSYKSILDNYEKEMTITGDDFGRDRIEALEKNLEEYRGMVEMLEGEKKDVTAVAVSSPRTPHDSQEIVKLKSELKALEERNQRLVTELERRALRGDFDPVDTKVIHFSNNPFASAVDKRKTEMTELVNENSALKARVQLLEEGHTKDLTLMVGAKVEEGVSQKLKDLNVELEKAQKKENRLMEAFKKTSQDFREVVFKLTGYRIDALQDNRYRLTPQFAQPQDQAFLFDKSEDGEILLLESELCHEMGDLMREHLEENNSIPMFLAAVTRKLFDNHQRGSGVIDVDEYQDGDEDEEESEEEDHEMENENDEQSDANSSIDNSNDSDEIIEIDDD